LSSTDLLQAAVQRHQSGQYQEAEKRYRQILAKEPNHPDANHLLGLLAYQGRHFNDAIDLISKAIASDGMQAMYHNSLGLALKDTGQAEAGVAAFLRAISLNPNYPEAHNNLALVCLSLGQTTKAIEHFQRTLELAPGNLDAQGNLGNAFLNSGNLDAAIDCFQVLIAAQPHHPQAHCHLGVALQGTGNFEAAMAAYRQAINIDPSHLEAHINLGLALQNLGDIEGAEGCFREALARAPEFAEAHSNLGVVLQQKGLAGDALGHLQKAIELAPEHAKAHANLGTVLIELGDPAAAVDCFTRALDLQPRFPTAHSNLLLARLYLSDTTPADSLRLARQTNHQLQAADPTPHPHPNRPDPDRPLKIGFVSADLRHHAVSSFLESVWSHLNAPEMQIFAYTTSAIEDGMSDRLKKTVTGWRSIAGWAVARQAALISEEQIDILVDLGGHTAHNSLPLFALKPAPVQISWLGYSATTGLDAMDYILGDPWVTPDADADQYAEEIWRLPDSYLCYTPPDIAIETTDTPALHKGHITFGSFNNLSKLTDTTISCWAAILKNVADSRLLVKAKQLNFPACRTQLLARFEAAGISHDRVQLVERSAGVEAHLASYNQMDIALDTFPYAGTTTTAEALWMGVPVLALKGDRFVARVGESLLRNCGLDDWVALSSDELIEKAARFSDDVDALNSLRHGIRHKFRVSPACDAARFAGHMHAALRHMWRIWCKEQAHLSPPDG